MLAPKSFAVADGVLGLAVCVILTLCSCLCCPCVPLSLGKSTTTGHLIYKCGGIDKRTIEKFEKASDKWQTPPPLPLFLPLPVLAC
jgi:hypothetical protein